MPRQRASSKSLLKNPLLKASANSLVFGPARTCLTVGIPTTAAAIFSARSLVVGIPGRTCIQDEVMGRGLGTTSINEALALVLCTF